MSKRAESIFIQHSTRRPKRAPGSRDLSSGSSESLTDATNDGTMWKGRSMEPRATRPIIVVEIGPEHLHEIAQLSTRRLVHLAAAGSLLARAALLRYRRSSVTAAHFGAVN